MNKTETPDEIHDELGIEDLRAVAAMTDPLLSDEDLRSLAGIGKRTPLRVGQIPIPGTSLPPERVLRLLGPEEIPGLAQRFACDPDKVLAMVRERLDISHRFAQICHNLLYWNLVKEGPETGAEKRVRLLREKMQERLNELLGKKAA